MKSIFLCNKKNSVEKVYAESFDKLPEVERKVYTSAEVIAEPEKFAEVEYVFSTWGMPSMSEEEIEKSGHGSYYLDGEIKDSF